MRRDKGRRATRLRVEKRLAVVMSAAVLVLAGATPGATQAKASAQARAAKSCPNPTRVVLAPDGWTHIRVPLFPVAPQELTGYAVDPNEPETIFATNGPSVVRSEDGGCTWTDSHQLDEIPLTNPTVTQIVVHPSIADQVYLVVREDLGGLPIPHVLKSSDGGDSWAPADDGLLPSGDPLELVAAEDGSPTMYFATAVPGTGVVLYRSGDAGDSWESTIAESLLDASRFPPVPDLIDLAVDPLDPQSLWGASQFDGVVHSEDGGVTWEPVDAGIEGPTVVDVFHARGADARIWAFGPGAAARSDDGGGTWTPTQAVSDVDSVAHGATADEVLAISQDAPGARVRSFESVSQRGRWTTVKESPLELHGMSADASADPRFYAYNRDTILRSPPFTLIKPPVNQPRRKPPQPPQPPNPPNDQCNGEIPQPSEFPEPPPPSLTPADERVELRPGESRTIPYRFHMWGSAPVDVYFLIDASGSMGAAICGAANGSLEIASRLLNAGLDAWFGIGTYQDMVAGQGFGCYVYERHHEVAPLGPSFAQAARSIETCGGNEPQSEALYQSATGEGLEGYIDSGMDAGFRPSAVPVVVHISDEPLTDDYTTQDVPESRNLHQAIHALSERGIRQVGIAMRTSNGAEGVEVTPSRSSALDWLNLAAMGTGAIATEPVECGDGNTVLIGEDDTRIEPGEPLVCQARQESANEFGVPMGNAVVQMLLSLRNDAEVRMVELSDSGVVSKLDPDLYPEVNLRVANELTFDVTYTCEEEDRGRNFDVDLGVQVRGGVVAEVPAEVVCLAPEVPPTVPPDIAPKAPVAVAPVTPPPPPPPPAPIPQPMPNPQPHPNPQPNPQPQPNPNPQTNPQAQPQPNLQGAMAHQQQKQVQVAVVHATNQAQVAEQQEYSMTARRTSRDPLGSARTPVMLGGAALTLAFGCLNVRRRTRVAGADSAYRRR